jgi:tripartite-type tricarboxylate transporter receptor subunit TctC
MQFLRRVVFGCVMLLLAMHAGAQGYPARFIKVVIPGQAGGTDAIGRIIITAMGQTLGQQMVMENHPGANGIIGADFVAKAPPDGYTICIVNIAHAANASLYRNLPYGTSRDFAAVTQLVASPHMVAVPPSLPVKSIKELVALASAVSDTRPRLAQAAARY